MNPMRKNTPKGYNPYELMSGMQKFIRRSMEKEAMFCAYELVAGGLYPHMRNRLVTIVYEDIGLGNQELVNSINSHALKMDEYMKAGKGTWKLVLGYIILSACRGNKTRITDQFACAMQAMIVDGYMVDFSEHDFIYDMHTRKGKQLGRGIDHFFDEAAVVIESHEVTEYLDEERDITKRIEERGLSLNDYVLSSAELENKKGLF